MTSSIETNEELQALKIKLKEVRLHEKPGNKDSHSGAKERLESITKTNSDESEKLLEESKPTTKAIVELKETNVHLVVSELIDKNDVSVTSLNEHLANFLIRQTKANLDCMLIPFVINGMTINCLGKNYKK